MGSSKREPLGSGVPVISFDASPWGGGAIFWVGDIPKLFTYFFWTPSTLKILKAELGSCTGQTAFEFTTLMFVLITFSETFSAGGASLRATISAHLMKP